MDNFDKSTSQDQDYELWQLLTHLRYRIIRARQKELHQYGITSTQSGVLYAIHCLDNYAKPAEISRLMHREPQTTSITLKRMIKKGLIKKNKDTERKNVLRFSLTDKGQEALKHSLKREVFHKVWSVLSKEKRQLLRSCLEELLNNIESYK